MRSDMRSAIEYSLCARFRTAWQRVSLGFSRRDLQKFQASSAAASWARARRQPPRHTTLTRSHTGVSAGISAQPEMVPGGN